MNKFLRLTQEVSSGAKPKSLVILFRNRIISIQDVLHSIFALLNRVSAVEECDATEAQYMLLHPGSK